MAKQLAKQSKGGFTGNTKDNPKNENFSAIELRNKKVLMPLVPKAPKKSGEEVVEDVETDVVEKNDEYILVENDQKEKNKEIGRAHV